VVIPVVVGRQVMKGPADACIFCIRTGEQEKKEQKSSPLHGEDNRHGSCWRYGRLLNNRVFAKLFYFLEVPEGFTDRYSRAGNTLLFRYLYEFELHGACQKKNPKRKGGSRTCGGASGWC
jgi:hypothetical protein